MSKLPYIAAIVLAAGTVRAQTVSTPLTHQVQNDVPGVLTAGTPAAANLGDFETWAFVQSVLNFDITDSTLDCGIVGPGNGTNVPCSTTGTNATNTTASMNVSANADWGITINDGFVYSAAAGDQNIATMTVDVPYNGTFVLKLSAVNGITSTDPVDATAEVPNPNAPVTISAVYDQSTASTDDPMKVDNYDNFGHYLGYFTVVLHER